MQGGLAERSRCPGGAHVGGRRCLREAKGRPGFGTAEEPGLQQPNKVQIWTLKRLGDKTGGKVEKGFRDSSSAEPRKVGNGKKPKQIQHRGKKTGRCLRLSGRNTEMNIRHHPCYPLGDGQ